MCKITLAFCYPIDGSLNRDALRVGESISALLAEAEQIQLFCRVGNERIAVGSVAVPTAAEHHLESHAVKDEHPTPPNRSGVEIGFSELRIAS